MKAELKKWESYRVAPGAHVRLGKIAADSTELCASKEDARKALKAYRTRIDELAAELAAENQRSFLVILQGMDAAGKDGAVKKVFTGVNPEHCKAVSFKPPDREEKQHGFLWRVYRALPAHGELGVFNRSQYEDVVTCQARGEIKRPEAQMRLRQIAEMERAWTENGIVIRKFFLHISRDEQTRRFQARLDDPKKHWKVDPSDFDDRKLWPRFHSAYEEALERTSTNHAPWYIIPANHKWYRDISVAALVLTALESMKPRVPVPKLDRSRLRL